MQLNNDDKFQDFMKKYDKAISEQLAKLEAVRQKLLSRDMIVLFISVILFFFIYIIFPDSNFWVVLLFILLLFSVGYAVYINQEYKKYLKRKILHKVLRECFDIQLISEEPNIFESELWSKKDLYISRVGDCFKMLYKNLECKIYELTLSSIDKKIINFNGVVIQLPNNKKLNGVVKFKSKNSIDLLLSVVSIIYVIILLAIFHFADENVKLLNAFFITLVFIAVFMFLKSIIDSPITINPEDFKRDFEVYADNISDAKLEATPKLITKIYRFKSRFKGKAISCSFYDDKILLAVNGGFDLFEIGNILIPINEQEAVNNFYNDINMLYEVMDYFFE